MTWTAPVETTDRRTIRHPGPTRICRTTASSFNGKCENAMSTMPPLQAVPGKPTSKITQRFVDQLPPDRNDPSGEFTYAVESLNDRGQSAGLSSQVQISAAPTLPPPSNFAATVTADGIVLKWDAVTPPTPLSGLDYLYRICRRADNNEAQVVAGELPLTGANSQFTDHNFQWEKTYSYHLAVVTVIKSKSGAETQVEGDDMPDITVFAHDVFPPAAPSGLQAVFTSENHQNFIDLIWNPNTESDLAGYNIFRRVAGGPLVKLNSEIIKPSAYRDLKISSGNKYYYSVSAIDTRGNESPRSEETTETAP